MSVTLRFQIHFTRKYSCEYIQSKPKFIFAVVNNYVSFIEISNLAK